MTITVPTITLALTADDLYYLDEIILAARVNLHETVKAAALADKLDGDDVQIDIDVLAHINELESKFNNASDELARRSPGHATRHHSAPRNGHR